MTNDKCDYCGEYIEDNSHVQIVVKKMFYADKVMAEYHKKCYKKKLWAMTMPKKKGGK